MVKTNPDDDSIHSSSLILEEKDKQAIDSIMENTPVKVLEKTISNPTNDLEGLYIQIASVNRDDLYDDSTMRNLNQAATKVGYNGSRMDKGNFPSKKSPNRFDDFNQDYYTLAIWFKHRM